MSKRPTFVACVTVAILCIALVINDALYIVVRPLLPWFTWMLP